MIEIGGREGAGSDVLGIQDHEPWAGEDEVDDNSGEGIPRGIGVEAAFHLAVAGFDAAEITVGAPAVTDRLAQQYGGNENVRLRYIAMQTVTVYSGKIEQVRASQRGLADLGKKGIAFGGGDYQQTQYLFTKLNDVKPAMIEEATRKAREVAEKFAADSSSKLGKIKGANQGQFSVEDRDSNTPYIKRVRVVSTVDYYLSD